MKFLLIVFFIASALSLVGQTKVTGRLTDFETGKPLTGAVILEENSTNGSVTDSLGFFEFYFTNNGKALRCNFVGYYDLRIINIPDYIKHLELTELRHVKNYSERIFIEIAPSIEPDMPRYRRIRKRVKNEYRMEVFGGLYEPTITNQSITFDLNKPSDKTP